MEEVFKVNFSSFTGRWILTEGKTAFRETDIFNKHYSPHIKTNHLESRIHPVSNQSRELTTASAEERENRTF